MFVEPVVRVLEQDIMEASVAGLVGEETKLAHRGGKRKSSGSSRRSTVASSASHQNASVCVCWQ